MVFFYHDIINVLKIVFNYKYNKKNEKTINFEM